MRDGEGEVCGDGGKSLWAYRESQVAGSSELVGTPGSLPSIACDKIYYICVGSCRLSMVVDSKYLARREAH